MKSMGFSGQQAPCGQIVGGNKYEDQDEDVLVTQELIYDCGCRSVRHEYHDGSVSQEIVRHDGKVLADQMHSAE